MTILGVQPSLLSEALPLKGDIKTQKSSIDYQGILGKVTKEAAICAVSTLASSYITRNFNYQALAVGFVAQRVAHTLLFNQVLKPMAQNADDETLFEMGSRLFCTISSVRFTNHIAQHLPDFLGTSSPVIKVIDLMIGNIGASFITAGALNSKSVGTVDLGRILCATIIASLAAEEILRHS